MLAQYYVGRLQLVGTVVAKDDATAVSWLRKAAGQGYVPAMHDLGVIYERGPDGLRDVAEAARWYKGGFIESRPFANQSCGAVPGRAQRFSAWRSSMQAGARW